MLKILCFLCSSYLLKVSASKTTFEKNGITFERDEDGDYNLLTHEILVLQPGSIADVQDVYRLYLMEQKITGIEPGTFQNLPSLKKLIIIMNKVQKITTGIFNALTNLTLLNLSSNLISHIDSNAFDNLTSLESLTLSNNRLTSVDSQWFELTPSLNWISIRDNQLTELPAHVFGNIKSPKPFTLVLDGNKIAKIDKDAFRGLTSISMLSLDSNKLKTVTGDFLEGLDIDVLLLRDNDIKCIDQEYFGAVFVANETDISENPWTPQCLTAIQTWAEQFNKTVEHES
ncbi:leucine-rich repeat-containing protein 70-like [Zophobas morio]|uniref:leucine-rich repeat-containing protein 70-like n=1 Tax=Zophobas morio TaxID=2755281 RepID=UPI003082CA11